MLVAYFCLIIRWNKIFHDSFSTIPNDLIISNNVPKALEESERNLSIVVQLVGAFGNQLSLISMGVMIQSMATRNGIKTSLHIKSEDDNHFGTMDHLFYNEENIGMYRRACQRCFPNLRSMMFLEGNEGHFQEYLRQHDMVLGPEIAKTVRIHRFAPCREANCIAADVEKALETVQDVWQHGELTLESGQWNSTFKEGTILGPYSFPMIISNQFPQWTLFGRFYDELLDFFQVDEECFNVQAHPDEVVYYYRDLKKLKSPERPYHDNMGFDSIATKVLGHMESGDKLAIVIQKPRATVTPLVRNMRARNVTVRVICNKDLLIDFFFLLSAQRELIGRGESTFFQWAALLNREAHRIKAYFVDNGSKMKFRYLTAQFPPVIENPELQKRLNFELFNI